MIDEAGVARAMTERGDLKYITDIAPETQAEMAEKFGTRFFATAKKMGAETAEANINAGLLRRGRSSISSRREILVFRSISNPIYDGTERRPAGRSRPVLL